MIPIQMSNAILWSRMWHIESQAMPKPHGDSQQVEKSLLRIGDLQVN